MASNVNNVIKSVTDHFTSHHIYARLGMPIIIKLLKVF